MRQRTHPDDGDWSVAFAAGCELGERPVWDPRTETLWWVDILAGVLHSLDAWHDHHAVQLDAPLGAVGLRERGGLVVASGRSIVLLDKDAEVDAEPIEVDLREGIRFNDGAVDPAGRFIVGTTATDVRRGAGALYSVDGRGGTRTLIDGVTESNGVGWSPNARTMYYVDSGEPVVRRYVYDCETGNVRRSSDLVALDPAAGTPDGLVVDAQGGVWVAMWGGGSVRRYGPDGSLLLQWPTPVAQPTCPGFGKGDQLYLTTAWEGLDEAQRAGQPWAGDLLVRPAPVVGLPASRFVG
jgi:sugar lactone lactonase YvrE